MRPFLPAFAAMLAATPSFAGEIVIPLGEDVEVETTETIYDCSGREVAVTYINAGDISLAMFEIDGKMVVASNVFSVSGAQYAGGRYVWWTKGDTADLHDLTLGRVGTLTQSCVAKG